MEHKPIAACRDLGCGFVHGSFKCCVEFCGGQLHDHRLGGRRLHRPGDLGGAGRVGAEAHAAVVDVGAADVDLQPAHLRLSIQSFAGVSIIFHGKTADIGHNRLVEALFQLGKLLGNDFFHTGILQAHGVDHTGGTLGDSGGGVAEPGILGRALEGEAAEDVDIVPLEKGMLTGVVTSVSFLGVHYEIIVDIGGFKWMIQTTDEHFVDDKVGLFIEPDAIHIMKKSEYSGLYGDYSSYSEEIDHLSDIIEEE